MTQLNRLVAILTLLFPLTALAQPAPPAPPAAEPAPEEPAPEPPPPVEPATEPLPAAKALPPLDLPPMQPGTLARGSALTLAAATFSLRANGQASNDVDDEVMTYGLTLDARWFGSLEKENLGWSADAAIGDSLSRIPLGDGSLYENSFRLSAVPEGRYYPKAGSKLFVYGAGSFDVVVRSIIPTGTGSGDSDSLAPGSVALAVGGGAGRVLAVDPIVRLRRLEQALTAEGALRGPVAPDAGTDIIRTWYALRNDVGLYRTLAYTMAQLDAAGVLDGAPSLRATYVALQVLGDPFIVARRVGWEARGGIGVVQSFIGYDDDPDTEPDPVFALLASGQYELPLATDRQLSLRGKLYVELGSTGNVIDPMGDPHFRPWSLRGFATYTRAFYDADWVPLGAVTLSGEAGMAGTRSPEGLATTPETGLDAAGTVSYSRAINRASFATLAARGSLRNDGVFQLTVDLAITWGVASGFYTPYTVPAGL